MGGGGDRGWGEETSQRWEPLTTTFNLTNAGIELHTSRGDSDVFNFTTTPTGRLFVIQ